MEDGVCLCLRPMRCHRCTRGGVSFGGALRQAGGGLCGAFRTNHSCAPVHSAGTAVPAGDGP